MTENQIGEQVQARDEEPSTFDAPFESTVADSTVRRFTVSGLKRIPHAYIPTIAIGALVVIVATVVFVADILGK